MSIDRDEISVTAIVTTYERPQLARRAIRSVLAQTYAPIEILVVEDGSDSGIEYWLQQKSQRNVRYVCHDQNLGLAAARNTGLGKASGEYVAYLDDDDEWKPERIEKQIDLLQSLPLDKYVRTGVVYCTVENQFADRSIITDTATLNAGEMKDAILQQGPTPTPSSLLFKTEVLREVGGFDENLDSSIDHDIWMVLADAGSHAYFVAEPLVVNSKEGNPSMVTNTEQRIQGLRQYVEKWTPVFQRWLGDEKGVAYADRYFTDVMAKLAADKIAEGKWKEVWEAVEVTHNYTNQYMYASKTYLRSIEGVIARTVLPEKMYKMLRKVFTY